MPVPGFVRDADVVGAIQSALAVSSLDAGTPWEGIAHVANMAAYGQIRAALLKRGFSAAQVDSWDQGAEFQLDLATYWALVRGGLTKDFDPKFIDRLDRRKELATVYVTAAGNAVNPASPRVARGEICDPVHDVFSMSDRDLWDWQIAGAGDNARQGGLPWPGVGNINQST